MKRLVLPAVILTLLGVAWAAPPVLVNKRGWAPLVRLAGGGDEAAATQQLRSGLEVFHSLLHGLDIDDETSSFISSVRSSLDDFDLSGFHEKLPERDGAWRRLRVIGQQRGEQFRVRQGRGVDVRVDPAGAVGSAIGDLGVELRARPVKDQAGDVNYLLRGELGVGLGAIGWDAFTASLGETARLLASGDPRVGVTEAAKPAPTTIQRLRKTHPNLRGEDLEALGVLWESFPQLGDLLHRIARAEDIMVFDPKGDGSYQQLRIAARLRADLMEDAYPELSEFLEDLGGLAHTQMVWVDPLGRQMARLSFDTKTLLLSISCFVKDGRLLPVANGKVVTDALPETPKGEAFRFKGLVDITSEINGISTHIKGLVVDWSHTRTDAGADLGARITRTPKVTTSGRAFGFIPTWAIDVLIPGNIDELTREFLDTATQGNEGRGMAFDVRARQAPGGGPGTVAVSVGVELLDSMLISIAMRVASLKLLPNEEVQAEIGKLFVEIERAFGSDLERFAELSRAAAKRG